MKLEKKIKEVFPSQPFELIGWKLEPSVGEFFHTITDTKENSEWKNSLNKLKLVRRFVTNAETLSTCEDGVLDTSIQTSQTDISFGDLKPNYNANNPFKLKIMIFADSHGSLEAILNAIQDCKDERVKIYVLRCGIGSPTPQDMLILADTQVSIYFFNNKQMSMDILKTKDVKNIEECQNFEVIYHFLNHLRERLEKKVADRIVYNLLGEGVVQKLYQLTGRLRGTVAGCKVLNGEFILPSKNQPQIIFQVFRGIKKDKILFSGPVKSIRIHKKEVEDISVGNECGLMLKDFNDFYSGDVIKCIETKREYFPLNWKY